MENANKIEERLKNMRKLYDGISGMLDSLPASVPEKAKEEIKRLVLGDDELKEMLKSADESRLPRILLVGRTGVGKRVPLSMHYAAAAWLMWMWRKAARTKRSLTYSVMWTEGN